MIASLVYKKLIVVLPKFSALDFFSAIEVMLTDKFDFFKLINVSHSRNTK